MVKRKGDRKNGWGRQGRCAALIYAQTRSEVASTDIVSGGRADGGPALANQVEHRKRCGRDSSHRIAVTARRGGKQSMCASVKQRRGMQSARGVRRSGVC